MGGSNEGNGRMAKILMLAIPGHLAIAPGCRSTVLEITARPYARETVEVRNLDELRPLVKAFGERTVASTGGKSFMVSMTVAGGRKPSGFDAANRRNGLGEEAFMRAAEAPDYADAGLTASAPGLAEAA